MSYASSAATWFVNVAQTNNPNTGISWANALTNVQQAISPDISQANELKEVFARESGGEVGEARLGRVLKGF